MACFIPHSGLQQSLQAILTKAFNRFSWLTPERISVTWLVDEPRNLVGANYQGDRSFLHRDLDPSAVAQIPQESNQIHGFFGEALPPTTEY